jgi:Mg2+ and Co2+ transporter CorA
VTSLNATVSNNATSPADACAHIAAGSPSLASEHLPTTGSAGISEPIARWSCWPPLGLTPAEFFDKIFGSESKQNDQFRWYRVTDPNSKMMSAIAREAGISEQDLARALAPENRAAVYHRAGSLVVRLEEIVECSTQPGHIDIREILVFCNRQRLITIAPRGGSTAVDRVWEEVTEGAVKFNDVASTNYLLTRLFGATLHTNETTIAQLMDRLAALQRRDRSSENKEPPAAADRELVDASRTSASLAQHSVNVAEPICMALGEPANTFERSPREALGRYNSMITAMKGNLAAIDKLGALLTQRWDSVAQERQVQAQEINNAQEARQNLLLFRLTVLGGILGPLAVSVDLLQTPMAASWKVVTQVSVIGGALLFSAGLIAGLRAGVVDRAIKLFERASAYRPTENHPPPPVYSPFRWRL